MKQYTIYVIFKDLEKIELSGNYNTVSDIFGRLTSELILRNRTENEILKLSFKL